MFRQNKSEALSASNHFDELITFQVIATQPYTHRENLRRRFGLVLRNAEHVDSRSSQEARTIGRVGGMWLGALVPRGTLRLGSM